MTALKSPPDTGRDVLGRPEPEFDQSWVKEAPLKLIASALESVENRTGKPGVIREVLEDRVELDPKWPTWWKRVKPMLEKSGHFIGGKQNAIILLGNAAGIVPQPLPPPPGKKSRTTRGKTPAQPKREWLERLTDELEKLPPSRAPTKPAYNALEKCPDGDLTKALNLISQAATKFLDANQNAQASRTTQKSAAGWVGLVSRAASSWRDRIGPYSNADSAQSVGTLLARLIKAAGYPQESRFWLNRTGDLAGNRLVMWPRAFAAGVWQSFDGSRDGAREWVESLFHGSTHEDRLALAREIALASFNKADSSMRNSQLESLLGIFRPSERIDVIRNVVIRSALGEAPKDRVLDFVAHICRSNEWPEPIARLNLLVLASLLLSDGSGPVPIIASQEIGAALDAETAPVDEAPPGDALWSSLLSDSKQRVTEIQQRWNDRLDNERVRHDEEREKLLRENNTLCKRVEELSAEIERNREQSKLDILEDPLRVIAENLKWIRQRRDDPVEMLHQAEVGLSLALRAGGAELIAAGETVHYEPSQHETEGYVPVGSQVRITELGAVVPGKFTGGKVLLKALVTPVDEGELCK